MNMISVSKSRIKHTIFPNLPRISDHPLKPLYFFSSSSNDETQAPETPNSTHELQPNTTQNRQSRTPIGKHRNPEKIEDIICRMMANRAWTTRLQNSIRSLVPVFDHNLVYNVLHSARHPDHALQFFRWVERSGLFKHDRETHYKIIEILGKASMLNHARCILLDMPKKGLNWDEDLFIVLIDSYGKSIVQESVKIFRRMEELGVPKTVKSYDVLFKVIMRRGRYMMAKRYFNKMLSEGINPSRHTYNVMIWGFFLSSRIATANRFFEDMKSRGISPDVVTYNTMLNGFYRVNKVDESEKLFLEMKGMNIEPSVVTYTTMIKGYVNVGRVDDGLKLFHEMKSFGIKPNEFTYSTLLPGLCDAGKMPDAHSIVKEMVHRHIAPKDNSVFLRLIFGHCKAGNLEAAADVLKSMMQLNVTPDAGHYGVLIESLCGNGVYDEAVKLLDQLIENEIVLKTMGALELEPTALEDEPVSKTKGTLELKVKPTVYNPMIEYLCNNGMTNKAETLFRQLMKLGVLDPAGFNSLIQGHSKEGSPDSAFEILKIMMRKNVPCEESAYKLLIESYLKKNEPADAKTAFDCMIENGHDPESSLYGSVMESLFEDGRVQTASRVMKTMIEKGLKEHKDLVFKILEALLLRGHVEEALGRIDLMMNVGFAPDFDRLLSVVCEKGKKIAAVKLLDYVLERDYHVEFSSYDKVLDALLAAGKTLNAYAILCKIKEKGGVTDKGNAEELIKILNEQGNTKQADVLSRMIKGAGGKKVKKQAPVAS